MDLFLHFYNNAFPVKNICVRDKIKNNWIPQGIKISSKKMRLLDNQRKTQVVEKKDLDYIEHYRKVYRRVIKEAKRRENNSYVSSAKNKLKAALQVINKEVGKSSINNKNIELRWGKTNKILFIAELFNSHFIEIVEKLINQYSGIYKSYMKDLKNKYMPTNSTYQSCIRKQNRKGSKEFHRERFSGFDDVTVFIVKKCVRFIKKPLTDICNASFASDIFPDRLKIAIIKPLYKKGNTEVVQNYRLISLLSVFSKIIEKLMYTRLMSFIVKNNILNEVQHGSREGRSTETAIHCFLENIQRAIYIKKKISLI